MCGCGLWRQRFALISGLCVSVMMPLRKSIGANHLTVLKVQPDRILGWVATITKISVSLAFELHPAISLCICHSLVVQTEISIGVSLCLVRLGKLAGADQIEWLVDLDSLQHYGVNPLADR